MNRNNKQILFRFLKLVNIKIKTQQKCKVILDVNISGLFLVYVKTIQHRMWSPLSKMSKITYKSLNDLLRMVNGQKPSRSKALPAKSPPILQGRLKAHPAKIPPIFVR